MKQKRNDRALVRTIVFLLFMLIVFNLNVQAIDSNLEYYSFSTRNNRISVGLEESFGGCSRDADVSLKAKQVFALNEEDFEELFDEYEDLNFIALSNEQYIQLQIWVLFTEEIRDFSEMDADEITEYTLERYSLLFDDYTPTTYVQKINDNVLVTS